jgi:KDO2-lipid IV(A) lauroyltransferase
MLYGLSEGIYFIIYHLAGYRKKVVMQNLQRAFPEKSAQEHTVIAKKFYHNLTDMMVESVKLMTISPSALKKRFTGDLSLLDELARSGKGYQIHLGHYFNWEWANLYIKTQVSLPFLVTYMPLSNKAANRLFIYIRSRFGSMMIPADNVQSAMKPWQDQPYISVLVADQNPGKVRRAYWFPFMNKMTAFYKGPELSARRSDIPVVFGEIKKVKRGYYHITINLITAHPKQEKEGAITRSFVQMLEKSIHEQPENWVWSHRRWKHEWKEEK